MKLDQFLFEKEPLNKLVSTYIESQQTYDKTKKEEKAKKETMILNSILVNLATKQANTKNLWNEINYCIEVNSSDRQCLRKGAQLLNEVFKRNPGSLLQTPKEVVIEIIKFSCEKAFITICGNEYISLIQHIIFRIDINSPEYQAIAPLVRNFIISNKLQVNTYRQDTRLSLYKIFLKLLSLEQKDVGLLEKSVRAGEGEKDPRNIGAVFELYLRVLAIYPVQILVPYRAIMFENIEAYYPIEFVGDEDNWEHRKVNVEEISSLLDQCLCHPFFAEESWELLSAKTAAPPLAPFISTILTYLESIRKHKNNDLSSRLSSLLIRFSEQEFIAEQYEEHAALDVSTVIERVVDVIFCRQDNSFDLQSYNTVKNWLESMIGKVTKGECKHSGTMMGIFRSIINKSKTARFRALIELIRSFSLKAVLKTINDGEIIPKLGLAVVAVSDAEHASEDVRQLIALLVLKVGSLYTSVSDEVKLLLLKILLQVYKSTEANRSMVRRVNDGIILKDILSKAQIAFSNCPNENQAYLIKAYIDFVATVYINEIDQLLEHVSGINFELQVYLIGRLWQNITISKEYPEKQANSQKIISKFNELIRMIEKNDDVTSFLKGLKVIDKQSLRKLAIQANWNKKVEHQSLAFAVLLGLRQEIEKYQFDQETNEQILQNPHSQQVSTFFLNHNQHNLSLSKEELLWRSLGNNSNNIITYPLLNKISEYDITQQLHDQSIGSFPPTFIQWYWQKLKGLEQGDLKGKRRSQLLKWLPQALLLKDRSQVLSLVLNDSKSAPSLLKIVKHIDLEAIRTSGIVEFCMDYIRSICDVDKNDNAHTTQRNVCMIASLISIAERDKAGQLKKVIRKSEKTLKELKLHRKRVVRQAVRRLLACLQQ